MPWPFSIKANARQPFQLRLAYSDLRGLPPALVFYECTLDEAPHGDVAERAQRDSESRFEAEAWELRGGRSAPAYFPS
jgi:hypothetical protein